MRWLASLLLLLTFALADHTGHGSQPKPAQGLTPVKVSVSNGWVRLVPASLKDTTVYMTLRNPTGRELRLVGASSPVAQMVMLMEDYKTQRGEQTIQGMREVKQMVLPKGGSLELMPGGKHLMLMGLKRPLREGEKIPIRLVFEGKLQAEITLTVERR